MHDIQHFLVTRFNVRQSSDLSLVTDPDWLTRRFDLFESFCLPSVQAQSTSAFRWLVFFDQATPEAFRRRIEAYAAWPNFEPVYTQAMNPQFLHEAVTARVSNPDNRLITTRLDNDDAVSWDFVQSVQDIARRPCEGGEDRTHAEHRVINFPFGYVWHQGRIYLRHDESNPFASMIEPARRAWTIIHVPHHRLAELGPIEQVGGEPYWLQVVHGGNVSNRVRGKRHSTAQLHERFVLADHAGPSRDNALGIGVDHLLLDHVRSARETAIRTIKPLWQRIKR